MTRLLLPLLLAAAACTPDFQAASDVRDLRVLAVQAEPPEAQFDDSSVDAVHVRVLAVDPSDPSAITMHAQLCAPTDSRRCDEGGVIDLGVVPLTFDLAVPPEVIALARESDDLKGFDGIRVQFAFSLDHGDPRSAIYGSKVLLFSPRGGKPNRNPQIAAIKLSRDGQALPEAQPGATLELPREVEIGLRPDALASLEQYTTVDLRGNVVTLPEQPRYFFFVGPGAEIDRDTADEPVDHVAPPDGLSRVTLHGNAATLWIVVRDGRGGESWVELDLAAAP
jgi:hypothetical protein